MSKDNIVSNVNLSIIDDEGLLSDSPAKRLPNFHLVDIEGNLVEEDVDYFLEMYDQPEDVVKLSDYMDFDTLYATYRLNLADRITVRYSIIDGIHYLTNEKKYFQVCEEKNYEEDVIFAEDLPVKKSRLEFHVTENNTFKIAEWNSDFWLEFDKKTLNHSEIKLNIDEDVTKSRKPLELLLKKDTKEDLIPYELNDNFEVQWSSDPLIRVAIFQLLDIEGNPVEQNIDYCLEMYDMDEDVLNFYDNILSATMYQNELDKIIVRCCIINGICYLVWNNQYLQVVVDNAERDGNILVSKELPKKDQRLQFQVTENNTFKVVQWNQRIYLSTQMLICNYTDISFRNGDGELELYLKRHEE